MTGVSDGGHEEEKRKTNADDREISPIEWDRVSEGGVGDEPEEDKEKSASTAQQIQHIWF